MTHLRFYNTSAFILIGETRRTIAAHTEDDYLQINPLKLIMMSKR